MRNMIYYTPLRGFEVRQVEELEDMGKVVWFMLDRSMDVGMVTLTGEVELNDFPDIEQGVYDYVLLYDKTALDFNVTITDGQQGLMINGPLLIVKREIYGSQEETGIEQTVSLSEREINAFDKWFGGRLDTGRLTDIIKNLSDMDEVMDYDVQEVVLP